MPITPLISKKIGEKDGRTVWEIVEPVAWTNGVKGVIVPVGFQCDFCSVPRVPLAYLLVGAIGEVAGTCHDYLYREGAQVLEGGDYHEPTRDEADSIFFAILGEEGVSWWKRKAMYYAVKCCAGGNWHKRKVMDKFMEVDYEV